LTRSIPKEYKQGLKNFLYFKGYKINELYPRRTRRATAVNWLIYWAIENDCFSKDNGLIPRPSSPPVNPVKGHFGDPEIKYVFLNNVNDSNKGIVVRDTTFFGEKN